MVHDVDNLTFGDAETDHGHDLHLKERATLAAVVINLPLGILKVLVGFFGHSQALLADGIDSLLDVVGAVMILGAVRIGAKSADHDHPYGHARIETAATMLLAILLFSGGLWIGWNALNMLIESGNPVQPGWLALAAAVLSLGVKEALFWYTWIQARRTRSSLLAANAWNYRSDAIASALAIVAIAGSMAGWSFLDPLGAMIIALILIGVGVRYAWDALRELVDTGLDPDRIKVVRQQIKLVPGVHRMRDLRTRTMGGHHAYADVSVLVDPYISLTEAHRISEAITERLVAHVEELADICIHIEPEGHEDVPAAYQLPLREEILERLNAAWSDMPIAAHIQRVTLHYVDDAVEVEIVLPIAQLESANNAEDVRSRFADVAEQVDGVRSINPLFQ